MTGTSALTERDRSIIARARELINAHDVEELRQAAGSGPDTDSAMVYGQALGVTQHLLGELIIVITRLARAAGEADPLDVAGQLADLERRADQS